MSSEAKTIGQIRVGGAIGGALLLIVRRPFSVLAWGLFTTLAGFVPLSMIILGIIPGVEAAAQSAAMAAQGAAASALLIQLAAAVVLAVLLAIVVFAVVDAAVYRAVLEPGNRGISFYLRVRRRELGIVGHFLAQTLLWAILIAIAAVPAAWIIGLTANSLGRSWAVLVSIAAALICGFVFGVVGVRFYLAGPITFDRGEIGLASSWRATRDRFGPILAVAVIDSLILWLWTYLLFAGFHLTLASAATAWVSGMPIEPRLELLAILTLYFGVVRVLVAAPAVLICRQLSPAVDAAPAPAREAKRRPLTLA